MQYVFVAVVIFTIASGYNVLSAQDSNEAIRASCMDVSEADPSKLQEARKGTYVEDDQVAAYFHCFFLRMDFITFTAEDVNKETLLKKLPISDNAKLKEVVESCTNKTKERADRKSHELYTCFVKESGVINDFA